MTPSHQINRFSFQRFLLICKRFAILHRRAWTIGFVAAFGFLLLAWLLPFLFTLSNPHSIPPEFHRIAGMALSLYVLGGCVLTSTLYSELHTRATSFQLLTLPVNRLELLMAGWATGALFYTAAALFLIFLLSVVVGIISAFSLGTWSQFFSFNPFSAEVSSSVQSYLLYQSVFLLGAIYFRGKNFLKTLLTLIGLFIGLLIQLGLLAFIIHVSVGWEVFGPSAKFHMHPLQWMNAVGVAKQLLWFLTIAAMLTLSYIRLKQKQVP